MAKSVLKKLLSGRYLLVTNVCSMCGLMALGDGMQQKLSHKMKQQSDPVNLTRSGQMALSGLPIGFLAHYWYRYLDRYLPGKALRTIIKKTAMDISIGSFALNILWFGSIEKIEGKQNKEVVSDMKVKLPVIIAGDVAYWTPLQFANFFLVPPHLRVIYVGCAELIWIMVLSFIQHDYKTGS